MKFYETTATHQFQDIWRVERAIPEYLQIDNGAYFIGDLRHARHFSRVVRLCLYFGVEPVFIAPRKPWMNGTIDDFYGEFEEKLWVREQFSDLEHHLKEAKIFLKRHSNHQDWKYRNANLESIRHRKISVDFTIDGNILPITVGKVLFIRAVNENGTINILNEDFEVIKSLDYEYIWETIHTKQEQLMIYYREQKG
ncbi:hypothetical protein C5S53_09860 [Methanophagales archaeon]|nr:hypothetical protein C5S53_09860 [Methanophagales archaeon]